jgi:hypothetical protein
VSPRGNDHVLRLIRGDADTALTATVDRVMLDTGLAGLPPLES